MKEAYKNLAFISLPAILILLIVSELILHTVFTTVNLPEITGKISTPDPMSEWAMNDPYSAFTGIPGEFSDGKTINSYGFISTPEIQKEKDSVTLRIVVLGESSTAGTGYILKDHETWPWVLSKLLNDTLLQKVEVINAAMGAYTSFESYGRLWSRLRFFHPDIILVNHGWNEMYYFTDHVANNPDAIKKPGWSVNQPIAVKTIAGIWMDDYLSWSQIYSRLRLLTSTHNKNGEVAQKKEIKDYYNKIGLKIWRENLQLIKRFCKDRGIELYVLKQPTLITDNTSKEDQARCKVANHGFDFNSHIEAYNDIYEIIKEEISESHIIDCTKISGISNYFHDHVHPTIDGAEEIANLVTSKMLSTSNREWK